jgi:hypothetical protein
MMKIISKSDGNDLFSHIPVNCIICVRQISIEGTQFTAYGLKLRIRRIGYVGVPARFPGLIIGTENFRNTQFCYSFLNIKLKSGERVKGVDNTEICTLKTGNIRIEN